MDRINLGYLALFILGSALSLPTHGEQLPPQPLTIDGAVTYVYKSVDGSDLRLHIFNPRTHSTAPMPAIVFFFGGGWTKGTVDQFTPQSKYLAQRGMIAVVADYRVFGRHGTSAFEAISDAKSAIRWLRVHSAELGIDGNRIAAGGGSAGGHLALSTALLDQFDEIDEDMNQSSKPNALVLFNPVVNTSPEPGEVSDLADQLLSMRFADRGVEGSPIHHLDYGLPPTIILHGKADPIVPYAEVEQFCAEAPKLGSHCRLVGYEDAMHGFFNPQVASGRWYRATLLEADRFLTHIGYLQGHAHKQ
jgi:acetyl esterase/lipase